MPDSSLPPSSPLPASQQNLGVPIAIVLAGGLIALALYFGGGRAPVNQPIAAASPAVPPQPTIGAVRPVTEADHVRGPANAKVTIIEYSDLECPFCKRFHPTLQQALREYPNDVRWVYRHFPIEQLHSQAIQESIATECAGAQGKFWELLDKIYEVTPSNDGLDLATLPALAREVGVADIPQFEACLKSDTYNQRITDDIADAEVAGGRGTPYTIVLGANGSKQAVSGAQPYTQLKAAIDAALK